MAVLFHGLCILGFGTVQLGTFQQNLLDTACLRAMWIFWTFALGVVLAVNRRPLLGHHAGCQPQPEAEKVTWDGVQIKRTVRLAAMQINRHASDRDVRHDQRVKEDLPAGGMRQPVRQEVQN